MSHGTHEPPPLLFPLLDLPCGPLALVYANLDAPMRHALMQTSKAARARCSLSSEATFVARCSAETAYFSRKRSSLVNPSAAAAAAAAAASSSHSHSQQQQQQEAGLLQGAALPGVHKARMVHDMARLPRTSIERFFKHSAARHLLATSRAALKHAPTRQLMAGVTHLTLQAWDLDDQEAPAIAQLLLRLCPRLRHLDASTCVASGPFLLALQRELCCAAVGSGGGAAPALGSGGGGSGGGDGGASRQAALTVVLPPSGGGGGGGGGVEGWHAACPSLKLVTSAPSSFTAKAGQGSPPNWAVSPARSRPAAAAGPAEGAAGAGPAAMRTSGGGGAAAPSQLQLRRYGIMH